MHFCLSFNMKIFAVMLLDNLFLVSYCLTNKRLKMIIESIYVLLYDIICRNKNKCNKISTQCVHEYAANLT